MNLLYSSILLSELVNLQSQQNESQMVEKFAEIQAISNWPMPSCMKKMEKEDIVKTGGRLLMNTGGADQPSEELLQHREEQSQPQDSPGQRDSLEGNAINQSPEDVNQQLEDNLLSMEQDMARPTKDKPRLAQDVCDLLI